MTIIEPIAHERHARCPSCSQAVIIEFLSSVDPGPATSICPACRTEQVWSIPRGMQIDAIWIPTETETAICVHCQNEVELTYAPLPHERKQRWPCANCGRSNDITLHGEIWHGVGSIRPDPSR
jgi:hypothetical protein